MSEHRYLPDTRPYPAEPVKRELLMHAEQAARGGAQGKLAAEALRAQIYGMLSQNFYLNLSVALSMTPSETAYGTMMAALNDVLQAKTDEEIQWFALPIVIVAGCKQDKSLPLGLPTEALFACLQNYPYLRNLTQNTRWLPYLVQSDELSGITPGDWWQAKQNTDSAERFLQRFSHHPLSLLNGQSVHVVYALGYGGKDVQPVLGLNLQRAGLPLMQVWQEALALTGATLFTNPLSPNTPLKALADGSHTRQRMAMDVFSTNAIRSIRMQSPRVGVVVGARAGGQILFGFNATDSAFEVVPQIFVWELASTDKIAIVQQNFLDLMVECQIEHIYYLHNALPENSELPTYAQALKLDGHNPLFSKEP